MVHAFPMEWHVRDFVAQPVQYLLSSRGGAIEQDKGKLVAAKARNHIPRPHRLFQFAAHAGQQHVADVMTRGVVHEFEAIKIDEAQRSEERRVGKEWVSTCRSRW